MIDTRFISMNECCRSSSTNFGFIGVKETDQLLVGYVSSRHQQKLGRSLSKLKTELKICILRYQHPIFTARHLQENRILCSIFLRQVQRMDHVMPLLLEPPRQGTR